MALEKSILKSDLAAELCFDYKPKEFTKETTSAAIGIRSSSKIRETKRLPHVGASSLINPAFPNSKQEKSEGILSTNKCFSG